MYSTLLLMENEMGREKMTDFISSGEIKPNDGNMYLIKK